MNGAAIAYWERVHEIYAKQDFITKPTIFAEDILPHLPHSGTILELGAGQGQDSRFFAKRGFAVTSTDLAPRPLAISQQLAKEADLKITFQEVDIATTLPFPDQTFTVVYSHLALHYFDTKTTAYSFSEINRVLKAGGMVVALLNTITDPEIAHHNFQEIEKDYYKIPDGIYKRFFSIQSLKDFTSPFFDPIVLDEDGRTYKDENETLIRFIGKKK